MNQNVAFLKKFSYPRRMAAAVALPYKGRYLILKKVFGDWGLPGGVMEPGESPDAAAIRETIEEIGITPKINRLLVTSYTAPVPGYADTEGLHFVFLGQELTDNQAQSITLQADEIASYQWMTLDEIREIANSGKSHILERLINGLNGVSYMTFPPVQGKQS